MFDNAAMSPLDSIGEFGLINKLTEQYKIQNPQIIQGIGDDAALMKTTPGHLQVFSTDLLIENVNFDLMYTPLKHLGYKTVITGISDIYAMNAKPISISISVAVSTKFTLEALEELYVGIYSACEKYKVDLIGGDTSTTVKGLTISVAAIGEVMADKYVLRSGCKAGHLLCVSGDLGGAYMGLQLMEREKRVFLASPEMQPDLDGYDYIIARQLKPEARKDVIELLESLEIVPSSMIDISDGLASEIKHLAKASKVGFTIYEDKLPVDPQTIQMAKEFNLDVTMSVLNGGEDYELLFTIDPGHYEKVKNQMDISIIGYATEQENVCQISTAAGNVFDLKAQGWV